MCEQKLQFQENVKKNVKIFFNSWKVQLTRKLNEDLEFVENDLKFSRNIYFDYASEFAFFSCSEKTKKREDYE